MDVTVLGLADGVAAADDGVGESVDGTVDDVAVEVVDALGYTVTELPGGLVVDLGQVPPVGEDLVEDGLAVAVELAGVDAAAAVHEVRQGDGDQNEDDGQVGVGVGEQLLRVVEADVTGEG